MPRAYYNEFDPFAVRWLRNLIAAGLIAPGDVDDRSILDVRPGDLDGYDQCHFFAGVGGWSLVLRLAGWPDGRPIWTGSIPCQPLSSAGLRQGHADERHLWPAFHGLIAERRPSTVAGEQVASADGREWFAAVRADLEDLGYAVGAADLCSPGVGVEFQETGPAEWLEWAILHCPDPVLAAEMRDFADWARREIISGPPNIRQRLYWVANALRPGRSEGVGGAGDGSLAGRGGADRLADADGRQTRAEGLQRGGEHGQQPQDGGAGRVADAAEPGRHGRPRRAGRADGRAATQPGRLRDADGVADPHQQQRERTGICQPGRSHEPADDRGADGMGDSQGLGREGREPLPGSSEGDLDAGTGPALRLEHADGARRDEGRLAAPAAGHGGASGSDGGACGLGHAGGQGLPARQRGALLGTGRRGEGRAAEQPGETPDGLDHPQRHRRPAGRNGDGGNERVVDGAAGTADGLEIEGGRAGARHTGWGAADWLFCTDERWRPVAPGTFPLASGIPGRVGLLRGAGNAINPEIGAEFMRAVMEVVPQ